MIIQAPNIRAAARIFKEYYPNPYDDEVLNCSDYYTEEDFKKSGMENEGNRGAGCHCIIGPHNKGRRTHMSKIIKVINDRIEEKGMSITVVATRANINPELLGRTLNGRRKLKADELVDLCRVLELTMDDFKEQAVTA